MKRDQKLIKKRIKRAGYLLTIKKESGMSYKSAFIEITEILGISPSTLKCDLAKFNREVIGI